jgi:hypothetical protein
VPVKKKKKKKKKTFCPQYSTTTTYWVNGFKKCWLHNVTLNQLKELSETVNEHLTSDYHVIRLSASTTRRSKQLQIAAFPKTLPPQGQPWRTEADIAGNICRFYFNSIVFKTPYGRQSVRENRNSFFVSNISKKTQTQTL